ncbi:FAD-binding oxidoreductase [Roseibium denhamense]|uniref:Glycine/D-amino acid oxidase n=1 Tax=Roseibium denhamense TaxID=76305 RepID=A0ABY1PMI4_9HYPH|nr:FAD-binding oxidoreductase [Roseibium denhamense]MTI07016.1 FAD-binding oxidoreductase [Roseibium denhamense]SMP36571.1 Glycine/D-amino acid oxidase [Roseibium denhamense]
MADQTADVVIIGGAVMGSSVAYHLAERDDFAGKIIVVEADPAYGICASARSAASIRQQFSTAINIEISLYGITFLRDIGATLRVGTDAPTIDLHEGGYLFLATPDKAAILKQNHLLQRRLGADIAHLDAAALLEKFPWLNVSDLEAGCHGLTGEGWFDGYGLMQAFRKKARAQGVEYVSKKASVAQEPDGTWRVSLEDGETISTPVVVNCAGASGGAEICRQAGLEVPIVPKKRCVFTFECRDALRPFPLLIDPNGTYVRPEGTGFICGSAPAAVDDPDCTDFDVDYALFEDHIWPTLAHRVPAFEAIKPGAAWAGTYDMNLFDHNAFIGPVPEINGFYLALGFSGHGLQQAPATGRGLAEIITTGGYETLDLSPLGFDRLAANQPVSEKNVV